MKVQRQVGGRRPGSLSAHALLESLENRRLLAGNVLATQLGSFLLLEGDQFGNELMLRSGNLPGVIIAHGMNQTRVNGTTQDVVFAGVEQVIAQFNGGNDWFKSTDLTLTSTAFAFLLVDGGTGDDKIEMKNTTIHASTSVGLQISGEILSPGMTSTGNDTIDLANTTIIAETGALTQAPVLIHGEENNGGNVTGGNDTITVTDTVISATSGAEAFAHLQIFGDLNQNNDIGGITSTIGQGNDSVSLTNTTVTALDGTFVDSSFVEIFGDFNQVTNFMDVGDGDAGTIGGGNDSIAVTNFTVSATGGTFTDFTGLDIVGDRNEGLLDDASPLSLLASIDGGNDSISVDNVHVTATGGTMVNSAHLRIDGDHNDDTSSVFSRARIGGGSDSIDVTNSTIDATGSGADSAAIQIFGDLSSGPSVLPPAEGDDDVLIQHVRVDGDFSDVLINTSVGDDTLDVQNSSFGQLLAVLNDGNDVVRFSANEFTSADLDGGAAHDLLSAHNNIGVLTFSNFEEENVSG